MNYRLEQLAKGHDIEDFDCGVSEQNDYLQKYAWQNQLLGYGQTFVAVEKSSGDVRGYYTLAMGNAEFENLPSSFQGQEGLPRYPAPTALIAQLGVDTRSQGEGLGEALVVSAIKRCVDAAKRIGAVAVEVHARSDDARGFYERYGFVQMQDSPNHLFLSMDVAVSFTQDRE